MEFRSRQRGSGMGIDMTPMIDCVFQLLIFFLLSSSFLTPALNLKLPRGQADQSSPTLPIVISVDAQDQILVNQQPVAKEQFRARLTEMFVQHDKREVLLRAHKGLAYEKVFEVMQSIQR